MDVGAPHRVTLARTSPLLCVVIANVPLNTVVVLKRTPMLAIVKGFVRRCSQ